MTQKDKSALSDRLNGVGLVTPTLAEGQNERIDTGRNIPELVEYIGQQLRVGGEATINAGRGLIEAKQKLPHGKWGTWLAEHFGFSARQAQRLMVIARNHDSNPTLASHLVQLGQTKAFALLALPESEREEFLAETHSVNGEDKTVIDMTSRELERAIRERDEARKAAELAKADAKSAQEAQAVMEESLKTANELLDRTRMDKELADGAVAALEQQLEELKKSPVDVAVMEVDQEQLDKARAEGEAAKAEELAQLQSKLDKAMEEKKKADEKCEKAEAAADTLKLQLEEAAKDREQAALIADPDMAKAEVYFNQGQEVANKLRGLLLKARRRENQAAAEKLAKAIIALSDQIRRCAE